MIEQMGDKKIMLCDSDLCTACSACENICPENAINMMLSLRGFMLLGVMIERIV